MNDKPPYQAEEAARLKALYKQRKKTDPRLSQELVAEMCGWTGQSAVSQYMTGKIPLNLQALLKFATALDFDPAEVSPRLIGSLRLPQLIEMTLPPSQVGVAERSAASYRPDGQPVELYPIEAWDDNTPLGEDEVELPFYKEVELSAGQGSEVMLETNGRKLRFGKRTLQRKNITASTSACATVNGNSMEPVLPAGSTVAIDTSATQVQDGKMYALDHSGQLRVKLLYRLPGGGLRLRSYNSEEHPDERYEAEYVAENIRVIGKVFWYSVLL